MKIIDLKDCSLFLIDGTGANYIEIRIGEGNFSYTEKRNIEAKKSRGNLNQLREGEQEVTDITFQFVWDSIKSSGSELPTIEEVFQGPDAWTSATPKSIDPYAPFTINLQIVRTYTCKHPNGTTTTDGDTYNFPEFSVQELAHSLKDATVDCKGFSNRVRAFVSRP